MVHEIAELRSAADVATGIEVHPETIRADQHEQADAIAPASVDVDQESRPLAGRSLE